MYDLPRIGINADYPELIPLDYNGSPIYSPKTSRKPFLYPAMDNIRDSLSRAGSILPDITTPLGIAVKEVSESIGTYANNLGSSFPQITDGAGKLVSNASNSIPKAGNVFPDLATPVKRSLSPKSSNSPRIVLPSTDNSSNITSSTINVGNTNYLDTQQTLNLSPTKYPNINSHQTQYSTNTNSYQTQYPTNTNSYQTQYSTENDEQIGNTNLYFGSEIINGNSKNQNLYFGSNITKSPFSNITQIPTQTQNTLKQYDIYQDISDVPVTY